MAGQIDGDHRAMADEAPRDRRDDVGRACRIMLHDDRATRRVGVALHAQLAAGHIDVLAPQAALQRRRRGQLRRPGLVVLAQEGGAEVERLVGTAAARDRHGLRGPLDARELLRQRIVVGCCHQHRHLHLLQRDVGAHRERRAIADAVMIAGAQEIDEPTLQRLRRRHIELEAIGEALRVPGEEDRLLAHARPQPGEVSTIPRGRKRWQVVRNEIGPLLLDQDHVAVGHAAGDAVRKLRGESAGDHRAGVETIGCRLLDAERVHELDDGIGEIIDLRVVDAERGREAEARRVRCDAGELLLPALHRREHVARGQRRLVQAQHHGARADLAVVHLACTPATVRNRGEMTRDLVRGHARLPLESRR